MARPRVFVSSTFYDLRQLRSDLELFIRESGFDPILNERGHIPYGSHDKLEEYCYREIGTVDILVSIVGARFGAEAQQPGYSISQMEVKTALQLGKQVYVFIDKNVHAEYRTYLLNKDNASVKYTFADDIRIYKFIEEHLALPHNNAVQAFEFGHEIASYLREQWSGLFQRLLQSGATRKQDESFASIQNAAATLNELVRYLTEQNRQAGHGIEQILLYNHPLFAAMRRAHQVNYPVFVFTVAELEARLQGFGYKRDAFAEQAGSNGVFTFEKVLKPQAGKTRTYVATIAANLFDDGGALRPMQPGEWSDEQYKIVMSEQSTDDDIPF